MRRENQPQGGGIINPTLELFFNGSVADSSPNNLTPYTYWTIQYSDGCYVGKPSTLVRYDLNGHYCETGDFQLEAGLLMDDVTTESLVFSATPYSTTYGFAQTTLFCSNGTLSLAVREANGTSNPNTIFNTGITMSVAVYSTIRLERTNDTLLCYKDGSLVSTISLNKSVFNQYSRYLTVGNSSIYNIAGNYFRGKMDYLILKTD